MRSASTSTGPDTEKDVSIRSDGPAPAADWILALRRTSARRPDPLDQCVRTGDWTRAVGRIKMSQIHSSAPSLHPVLNGAERALRRGVTERPRARTCCSWNRTGDSGGQRRAGRCRAPRVSRGSRSGRGKARQAAHGSGWPPSSVSVRRRLSDSDPAGGSWPALGRSRAQPRDLGAATQLSAERAPTTRSVG